MSKLKRFLLSLFLGVFIFSNTLVKPVYAQEAPQWYHSDFPDWFTKVYDPDTGDDIFAERYTAAQVEWVYYGIFSFALTNTLGPELARCVIINVKGLVSANPINIVSACRSEIEAKIISSISFFFSAKDNPEYLAQSQNRGVLSKIFLEDRPLSGLSYTRGVLSKLNLVQPANAQTAGFGYEAAKPVRELWKAARDFTYFLFILAIVVMAFMIMFRMKNSPQTVITIQSTLPKIIVGIILITFSYAIAGFMIDLMYVLTGFVAALLAGSGLFNAPDNEWRGMYDDLTGSQLTGGLIGLMNFYTITFMISLLINNVIAIGAAFASGIGGILLLIAVYVTYIVIMIKIIWALVKNFVSILLLIAASPFIILSEVVGGSGFAGWLKNLASHLAVYPVIGVMFALTFFFLGNSFPDSSFVAWLWSLVGNIIPFDPNMNVLGANTWVPPFTVFLGSNINMVWLVTSLMILSLIPKVPEMIKGALAGKPIAYGSAIGAPLAAGFGAAAFPVSYVGNIMGQGIEAKVKSSFSKLSQEVMKSVTNR